MGSKESAARARAGIKKRTGKPKGSQNKIPADLKQRILDLLEELEKNPALEPGNFIITVSARKDPSDKYRD